jgi:hypothetical protein
MEGERHPADQAAAADGAKHHVGQCAVRRELCHGFQPDRRLPGDDLRVVEGMQQDEIVFGGDLPRPLHGDFLARPFAVLGDDHARAISGRRVALGDRRVDRHDHGDRDAEPLPGRSEALREIARGISDHAAPRLVGRKPRQPPVGAAHLERSRPLQAFRLDEDAGGARLAGKCCRLDEWRHLDGGSGHGLRHAQMVERWNQTHFALRLS